MSLSAAWPDAEEMTFGSWTVEVDATLGCGDFREEVRGGNVLLCIKSEDEEVMFASW